MRRALSLAAFLLVSALVLVTPGPAAAQKKPEKNEDLDKKTDPLVRVAVVTGKIASLYEDKREINLSVPVPKLNPSALNGMAQAQQQMAQARARGDRQGMMNAQRSLLQAQNTLYTSEMKTFKFEARDDVVVRTARPREMFDDKGRIKKLSAKDLKELRARTTFPATKPSTGTSPRIRSSR